MSSAKAAQTKITDLVEHFKNLHESADRITPGLSLADVEALIDFKLGNPMDDSAFSNFLETYISHAVKTGNKQYFNQLFSGFQRDAVTGDLLAVLMNTSMYTFEVAPMATMMEVEVVRKMNEYTGFSDGDGIFTTGGSNSNLVSLICARHRKYPDSKKTGLAGKKPLSFFVSTEAHYSFEKAAFALGIGTDHLYEIPANERGEMIPEALEKAILDSRERGEEPFYVSGVAGTTEIGAFDPFEEIGKIAKKHELWFHIDGSWGGSILLSPKYRHLFRGIEYADSFAWNAHKLMNTPLITSILLTRDKHILTEALGAMKTDYIFHEHEYANLDLGVKSLQCGKRNDALKIWLAWKRIGDEQYARNIEKLFELAQYADGLIQEHPNLESLAPTTSLNINFRYVPDNKSDDLNSLNLRIREQLLKDGESMVNYVLLDGVFSIRLVLVNHELEQKDIDTFFRNYIRCAGKVAAEQSALKA